MGAMGGNLGLEVDLCDVIHENLERNDHILFSESAGRFIVTVSPDNKISFESVFKDLSCSCIGKVTHDGQFTIKGINTSTIVSLPVNEMKSSWKTPFGDLI